MPVISWVGKLFRTSRLQTGPLPWMSGWSGPPVVPSTSPLPPSLNRVPRAFVRAGHSVSQAGERCPRALSRPRVRARSQRSCLGVVVPAAGCLLCLSLLLSCQPRVGFEDFPVSAEMVWPHLDRARVA